MFRRVASCLSSSSLRQRSTIADCVVAQQHRTRSLPSFSSQAHSYLLYGKPVAVHALFKFKPKQLYNCITIAQ